jgi:transaldolase
MRIYVDTANLDEIREWRTHPWVSGFTTNPTLMRADERPGLNAMAWAELAVEAAVGYPISIDGPEDVWSLGKNVWRKVVVQSTPVQSLKHVNYTAVCHERQVMRWTLRNSDVMSVFAGRIMDTGRDPQPVIDAAKATGAQVLWASVREPYNIVQAEQAGCDIVTVPPTILRKWLDWNGKPLEVVAAETIAQFQKDAEGLWDS